MATREGRAVSVSAAFGRLLLVALSLAFAILGAEFAVRWSRPQVPPSAFEQRYLIDGASAHAMGWFDTRDPVLPVRLRPLYDHVVADIAWHPTAFRVSLDDYGYRNPIGQRAPDMAVIGDSVVFGFGVEASDALPGALAKLTGKPVDNLGIPNAGPESYPVILQRYASRPAHARTALVLIYGGNDWQNLADSRWAEAGSCRMPESKTYRRDIAEFAPNSPVGLLKTPWSRSQLATLLAGAMTGATPRSNWQKAQAHRLAAQEAAGTLRMLSPTAAERQEAIAQDRQFAAMVGRQACATEDDRVLVRQHDAALEAGDTGRASAIARQIVQSLIARGCERVDTTLMLNPVPWFSATGDYEWRRRAERALGPIRQYAALADAMSQDPAFGKWSERFRALAPRVRAGDRAVESEISKLSADIDADFPVPFGALPAGCDGMTTSLRTMRDIAAARGMTLMAAYSVSERQVQTLAPAFTQGADFCRDAEGEGIPCLNLAPALAAHAQTSPAGMYLDGAHFTVSGNLFAAQQIVEWLRRRATLP